MQRLHKFLAPALALGAAFAVAPATGCAGEARYVVETAPPPPRAEVVSYRPGYVWVQGYWTQGRGGWRWNDGHYVRERANHVYVQPRWERRGRSYVWVDGGWRERRGVVGRRR
ncbi:MAG: YXWGXW repeat-containing protein [Deltaproteobacteria bacterium]|nr:YXWGXW repeat-containing protein [Deltaproteobacteria bacterium]MDQ3301188.1 hypothetical protein [Myxococcota bacterium]